MVLHLESKTLLLTTVLDFLKSKQWVLVHASNPSTWEAEVRMLLQVPSQSGLQCELFQ